MEITRSVTLPTDPDGAWDLVTRPEDLAGWLGDDVDLDASPGATGSVTEPDGTRRELVVEEVEPGRRIAWRWWPEGEAGSASTVELTVAPDPGGALVTVVERLLPAPEPSAVRAQASVGGRPGDAWSHRMLHLELLALRGPVLRG